MISQLNKFALSPFLVHIIHLACVKKFSQLEPFLQKAQTERMRRRNAFLRMENKKQQHMAHQMEQMRDMFSEIDLEHLKQKNIQYSETLQNFQEQLICHRVLIRKSQQGLKVYKVQIQNTGFLISYYTVYYFKRWRRLCYGTWILALVLENPTV